MHTIATPLAPAAIGPYSQAVQALGLVFTSGQLPIDPGSGALIEEISAATRQSLLNVRAILEASGSSLHRVVKTTVFLRDLKDFAEMNAVYAEFFPDNLPARSTVQVAQLPRNAVVEIEVVALAA